MPDKECSDIVTKVIHVIGGLDPGGAETMLVDLLLNTASKRAVGDVNHSVVVLGAQCDRGRRLEREGIIVEYFNLRQQGNARVLRRSVAQLRIWLKLCRFIRQQRPSVIQSWLYKADLLSIPLAWFSGAKLFWGIFLSNLSKNYYPSSTWRAIRSCGFLAKVVPTIILSCTVSGARSHTVIGYPKSKIRLVHPGVDVAKFFPSDVKRIHVRQQNHTGTNDLVIGMLARWDPQKDHEQILRAAAELVRRGYRPRIWLAGGVGITNENLELAQLVKRFGLQNQVVLLGRVEDQVAFFNGLDIFCLVSKGEGFPLTLIEAMSCGLPCVSNDVGDVRNIIGSEFCLPSVFAVDELADALERLIVFSPAQRGLLGRQNRSRVAEKYSLDKMRSQYDRIYKDVASNSDISSSVY